MGSKFLSEEWARAATHALAHHPQFSSSIQEIGVSLQFEVSDVPQGSNSSYYLRVTDGSAALKIGSLKKPDISVATDYSTAASISKGELNIQIAFFSGKLKISGDLGKLLRHQAALTHLAGAVSSLDVEY